MPETQIVMTQPALLGEEERSELLALHRACKQLRKSSTPYEFEWLIGLLSGADDVYKSSVSLEFGSATLAWYGHKDDFASLTSLAQ
ncbi:hypothetical protein [Burkholderia ubonensis]|uniref:hypothetical protein n=1 Tax=Burkholderia ubonensis TaxID=101571 RepID=UPI0007552B18|nr:hypothetical protein [Burkholderia ubonensis]KVQ15315.1 hypothetical protein WK00_31535 [Burkholderia ubonensis]